MQGYKYDAFISYRHAEPDKTIAEKLHRMLESFKVPGAVVKMGSQKKVGRVFRDRDELPTSPNLAESIQQALESSEHLIVVCSPRTPSSQWVCKEIETFAELHGHERILALLIEGEPEESFPDPLRFVKKKVILEDGTETEEVHQLEPLAADIRDQSLSGMKKKLKTEILRILAPILNCRFDDLKQRHRERKVKRALTLSFAISLFFLLFGSYSAYQAALIRQQSEVIKEKSEQVEQKSKEVEQKSKEVEQHAGMLEIQVRKTLRGQSLYLSDISESCLSNGNRMMAVLAAKEALPKNLADPERPYVEEAEYALCEALGVYETVYDLEFWADAILKHDDTVTATALSPGGKKVAAITYLDIIYIWNAENGMLLNTLVPGALTLYDDLCFLDDSTLLFRSVSGLHCINADTLEEKWFYDCPGSYLALSSDKSKAAIVDSALTILDTATGNPLMEASLGNLLSSSQFTYGTGIVFDESGSHVFIKIRDGKIVKVDLEQMKAEGIYQAVYGSVHGMAAGPGGRVAVISFDTEADKCYGLDVFDESGQVLYRMTTDKHIDKPAFSPFNGDQFIYLSFENLVILNIRDGSQQMCTHGKSVTDCHILDNLIISTSYDGMVRFWKGDGTEITMLRMDLQKPLSMLDFTPGLFVLTSEKETVLLHEFVNSHAITLEGHSEFINDMVFLDDGKHLVSYSYDGEIILWDLEKMEAVKTVQAESEISGIYSVDHGSKIMTFSDLDDMLSLYNAADLSLVRSEALDYIYSLVLSPDHSLACLFGPFEDRIIDTGSLETVMVLPDDNTSEAVFFNDNKRALLKTSKRICILDIPSRTIIREAAEKTAGLSGFRLSHDNTVLACISDDRSVKLLDANTLDERIAIDCTGPIPDAVFFDPWDKTLFISFNDHSVGRYSLADGTLISMLDKKVEGLNDVQFMDEKNIYITKGKAESFGGVTESYIWKNDTNKPVGRIRYLSWADLKSGRLFVINYDKLFILPVFDTRMLLDEAERQLKGRTLTAEEKKALFIVE